MRMISVRAVSVKTVTAAASRHSRFSVEAWLQVGSDSTVCSVTR